MAYRFDPLHGMDSELRDNDQLFQRLNGCGAKPTALFRAHALELLQMIVQAEMLFRWAARKLAQIRRLRFPYDVPSAGRH